MGLTYGRVMAVALFLLVGTVTIACEDASDECYSNGDCPDGCKCVPTYYHSGNRSGGYCALPEGGECVLPDGGWDASSRDSGGRDGGGDAQGPGDTDGG
jgi:hypothetical protein